MLDIVPAKLRLTYYCNQDLVAGGLWRCLTSPPHHFDQHNLTKRTWRQGGWGDVGHHPISPRPRVSPPQQPSIGRVVGILKVVKMIMPIVDTLFQVGNLKATMLMMTIFLQVRIFMVLMRMINIFLQLRIFKVLMRMMNNFPSEDDYANGGHFFLSE